LSPESDREAPLSTLRQSGRRTTFKAINNKLSAANPAIYGLQQHHYAQIKTNRPAGTCNKQLTLLTFDAPITIPCWASTSAKV